MPGLGVGNRLGNGFRMISANTNYFSVPHNAVFNPEIGNNWSIAIGFILNSGTTNNLLGKTGVTGGNFHGYTLRLNTGVFQFVVQNSGATVFKTINAITPIVPGKIYHLVISITGASAANWNLYLDGESDKLSNGDSGTITTIVNPSAPLLIGGGGTPTFNGVIYYAHFYNVALTQANARKIAENDGAITLPGLGEAWFLEEKTGTTTTGRNGNIGTLNGAANTALGASNQHVDNNQQPILT